MSPSRRRANQKGSALLIVFVFAAMVAIMLYREMPVAAFEAQRQKEELLIDRGNEYKRAIKLYVRKFQTFPASVEALENTNRMRFLRSRYVDPYSGKDDWRFLHAGPGGIIMDSKIKPKTTNLNGQPNSTSAGNNGFGTASSANASSTSANPTDAGALLNAQPGAAANPFPQRPPAVALNGGNVGSNSDTQADQQSTPPVPSPGAPYPGYPGPLVAPIPGQTDTTAQASPTNPDGSPFPTSRGGRFRNANPTGDSNPSGQTQSFGAPMGNSQDPQSMMQTLLTSTNPQSTALTGTTPAVSTMPGASTGTFSGAMNQNNTMGSGIAGVASKKAGHTIKVVNDQTDRSLWEFVYDMQKEAMANAPGMANGTGPNGGGTGTPTGMGAGMGATSTFNSPSQNNTFGNSFGNSANQPPATPQPSPNQ